MKRFIFILFIIIALSPSAYCAEYDYIDISNPFLRKLPIAIPEFKNLDPLQTTGDLGRDASKMISEGLVYTGYFKVLEPALFLVKPDKMGVVGAEIDFNAWTTIGAEMLITGGYITQGDIVEMELRLFDTFQQKLLVGKKYKGWIKDLRRMIYRFCGEIIFKLTGNRGVFNSKIAFVSTGGGNKEIYICDFDGRNPYKFTANKSINISPAWSSDGNWIAYTSYVRGKPDLYIRHFKEKRGTVMARKGINATPAWVPGRFALAATLSFSGDPEIYLLTGNGKLIKRLTHNKGIDVSPTWSPDGKKIAFVSRRSGSAQIYVKNLEKGSVRRITYEGRYNTQPSWSPKGDKIAYSSMKNGDINIIVTDPEGKKSIQLTHNSGTNESPSWSPDGSLIAFSSNREKKSRIYIMTAFGTDQRRLLTMPGEQTSPSWSPVFGN